MLKLIDQTPKPKRCIWYYIDSMVFAVSFFPLGYFMAFCYPRLFVFLFSLWVIAGVIMRLRIRYEKGASQKKPMVILRTMLYTVFVAVWLLLFVFFSQSRLIYPLKRLALSERFGTAFSQVIPDRLPNDAEDYYFRYVPPWQDGDYLVLKYRTDGTEAGRLSKKAAQMYTKVFEFHEDDEESFARYMRDDLMTEDDLDGLTVYEFDKYTRIYVNRRTGFVMFERS